MKSIVDILNSMAQAPTDPSGSLKKGLAAMPQDSSTGESFWDVLSRLTVQASVPAANDVQNNSISQDGPSQTASVGPTATNVQQAVDPNELDRSITALAGALSRAVGLVSGVQNLPADKVQNAIVSAGGGVITQDQAKDLFNRIDELKNASSAKNPLSLTAEQQGALVIQFLQNALQNQQVVLVQKGSESNASGPSTSGRSFGSLALQLDLSGNHSAAGADKGLSLDMETPSIRNIPSEASATSRTNLTQATTERLTQLLKDLQVNPSSKPVDIKVQTAIASSGNDPEMQQNFKNLVHVLTQASAGQVVLNSFLTREKGSAIAGASQGPAIQLEQSFRGGLPSMEVPPVNPTDVEVRAGGVQGQLNRPTLSGASQVGIGHNSNGPHQDLFDPENLVVMSRPSVDIQSVSTKQQIPVVSTPVNQVAVDHVSQVLQAPVVPIAIVTNEANVQTPNTQSVIGQNDTVAINTSNKPTAQTQPVMVDGHLEAVNNIVARFNSAVVHGKVAATNTLSSVDSGTFRPVAQAQVTNEAPVTVPSAAKTQVVSGSVVTTRPGVVSNSADVQTQLSESNSPATQQAHSELAPGLTSNASQTPLNGTGLSSSPVTSGSQIVSGKEVVFSAQVVNQAPAPVVIQQPITSTGNPVQVTAPLTGTSQLSGTAPQAPVATSPVTITQPASTAPNVPATAVVGEAVKAMVPPPAVENTNVASTTSQVVTSVSNVSAVQPVTAQAVTQVSTALESSGSVRTSSNLDKDTSADVLGIETAIGTATASITASQTGKSGDYEKVSASVDRSNMNNVDATRVLGQISRQVAAQTAASRTVTQLSFQLVPASLGKVTVQVALIDQAVSARIVVSNPDVREVLQHHMVDLKSALSQAGLQIDQLQVHIQSGGGSLLAQYYQYQQEGGAYGSSTGVPLEAFESQELVENKGFSAVPTGPVSLVNLLV